MLIRQEDMIRKNDVPVNKNRRSSLNSPHFQVFGKIKSYKKTLTSQMELDHLKQATITLSFSLKQQQR